MRIVCPNCEAAYDVPAPILARRRTLRCVQCQTDFMPVGEPAPPAPPAPAMPVYAQNTVVQELPAIQAAWPPPYYPDIADEEEQEQQARFPANAILVVAAWVTSFALLGAIGWGMVTWRGAVMQAWPASARLYAALGYRS